MIPFLHQVAVSHCCPAVETSHCGNRRNWFWPFKFYISLYLIKTFLLFHFLSCTTCICWTQPLKFAIRKRITTTTNIVSLMSSLCLHVGQPVIKRHKSDWTFHYSQVIGQPFCRALYLISPKKSCSSCASLPPFPNPCTLPTHSSVVAYLHLLFSKCERECCNYYTTVFPSLLHYFAEETWPYW